MKTLLLLSLALLTGPMSLAQDCGLYYDLRKGGTYELTTFDSRDQPSGRVVQEVREANTAGGKTTALIHQQVFDKKGKPSASNDYTVECQAGLVRLDMRAIMNPQAPGQNPQADMDVQVSGDFLELPAQLKPGSTLKNGTMTVAMRDKKSGTAISTTTISISNRRVEGTETIKTEAGSFACTKISQDVLMKTGIGNLAIPFSMRTVEWYAPGVGAVRSETYRKDKLLGYSLLTTAPLR
ncbi:TapB family protein [Hymenobacter psychrotolerans]|uniref:DUF3108 domain-containing protein n=1 Tax=Hymenobacter psychrotolerans DSM 18569 TaxID=1121959 RepID=A0A1M6PP24_9BACT|nr:hypothetical protein [Hymenobacter psychrotolerans]SHK09754.1 hypothetical protein SAMN02746009_00300 [Hymenobacter psychrotolerans DSM 18569]